jgi:hypothetical protein
MKGIGVGKKGMQILSFTGIYVFIPAVFVLGTISLGSCTKTNEFTIGENFVESQTRLQIVDTFKVDMSTILYDSIVTSSMKIAYVGQYEDNVFGSIDCKSYFDLAYESFSDIEDKAVFDSAAFILQYTDNNFGDTTSTMSISIHKLTENIAPYLKTYLFNTSSFAYEPQAIGTVSFIPEPHSSTDTAVMIPVNALGEELFNLIRNKDEKVSSQEWFTDYLKGFVLTSATADNKALIGFKATADYLFLRIYYHIKNLDPEKKEITVKMGDVSHQFNNVKYDFTNTSLYNIKNEKNQVPSTETGNHAFMQGMIGLLPKFRFPSLQNILAAQRWKVLKAELIFQPVLSSYDIFSLPDSLYIYGTDKENTRTVLRDSESKELMASFEYDKNYAEDTKYTFNITSFIINELADSYVDYEHGLIIGLNQDKLESSFDRLVIEGKNPPVKLRLYYLSY